MASQAKKRGRDDEATWEVEEALQQLQGALERDLQNKLRVLDKVISLVDPSDDQYTVQKALVDGDAAFYLTELLADPSAGVRAAEAVAAVCRHAAPSVARLAAGPLMGLDSSVERVSLNPCQSDFVDSGAVAALLPMVLSRSEAAREAATEALAALCSYHQDGKLAYLEGLVAALTQQQQLGAFELLDALIDNMECGGEAAAQQLELLLQPLASELAAGPNRPNSLAAVSLLGTLLEQRPEAAVQLRDRGAVAAVARHLLQGGPEVQDVAARGLWLLLKDGKQRLREEEGLLGCEPAALAKVLVRLIEVADAEEARAREDHDAAENSAEDDAPQEGAAAGGGGLSSSLPADICHAGEASQLLKLLGAVYPEVAQWVEEREVPVVRHASQKCCIM